MKFTVTITHTNELRDIWIEPFIGMLHGMVVRLRRGWIRVMWIQGIEMDVIIDCQVEVMLIKLVPLNFWHCQWITKLNLVLPAYRKEQADGVVMATWAVFAPESAWSDLEQGWGRVEVGYEVGSREIRAHM